LPRRPAISLWHFTRPSLEEIATKTNRYTTVEAMGALRVGRGDPSMRELFWRSFRELAVYGAKRGYRDGLAGLAYVLDRAYYRFLVQAKRWDLPRAATRPARYDEWREKILSGFPHAGMPSGEDRV